MFRPHIDVGLLWIALALYSKTNSFLKQLTYIYIEGNLSFQTWKYDTSTCGNTQDSAKLSGLKAVGT